METVRERNTVSLGSLLNRIHSESRVLGVYLSGFVLYLSHIHFGTVIQEPREALPLLHHQVIGHRLQPSETNTIVHVLHVLRVLTLSELSHSSPSTTF